MYLDYKLSDISIELVKSHLKLEDNFMDDDILLKMYIAGAIDHIKNYTNLSIEELDKHNSITVACMILIADFYENRSVNIDGNMKVNKMLNHILSMNRDLT